jgi:protein-tyrosine phosphatase
MSTSDGQLRVLFVCLGNICRSPSAEAVMRAKVLEAGLQEQIEVDSAGTGDWHVGEPPDPRATKAAGARGLRMQSLARQVNAGDFDEFDVILAMDNANLRALQRLGRGAPRRAELRLLREFEPGARVDDGERLDVPDPYYGGDEGFENVLDLLEASCAGLLDELTARLRADCAGRSQSPQARE